MALSPLLQPLRPRQSGSSHAVRAVRANAHHFAWRALQLGLVAAVITLLGVSRLPAAGAWKLMMAPNYVHEDLVGKAVALLQDPREKELGVQLNADLTAGDQWTDMPMGKDGALTHQPADIQGFLNLLLLSPFSTDFLLKQSQQGCLMHWHCMAPKLQGRENMALSNSAVRSLIIGQMSYWWDRAIQTRGTPLASGYIGHALHSLQDCHPRGHTIRDLQPLYSLTSESLAAEDDDDRAVIKLLDMPNQQCGRILYFQGDRAQNTAGVPPLDNDRTTHGGWDKLPHSPVSTLPPSVAPYEIPESLQSAQFKPEYDATESARQLQLERCSVYASYRVIRPWLRCVRATDADAQSVCASARQSALDFISEFVLQLPDELGDVLAGGAWDRIVNTDSDVRDRFYERRTLATSDVPSFEPVAVWVPRNHSRWNVSSAEATPLGFAQEKRVELPLCNYVKGTTRDDFSAASEEAGPFTDFYNPVAMVRLANGGQPCSKDQECVSGNCGGAIFGQDYCRCGPNERNCTDSESGSGSRVHLSIARVAATAALQLSLLFAAGIVALSSA